MPRGKKLEPKHARDLRRQLHLSIEAGGLTVAETIRRMRGALGMTQGEFGKAFGLTTRQVWELEAGVANPTTATLSRLGRPFGFVPGFVLKSRKDAAYSSGDEL
jgi:transcriptional regulator with XRE-family HTH domain